MARRAKKLQEIAEIFEGFKTEIIDTEDVTVLKELHLRMSEISDPRDSAYVRHELGDIIMITLLAVLSNANEWMEIEMFGKAHEKWLRRFLGLEHGIPSDDTFRIVISSLNTNYIYGIAIDFLIKKVDEIINLSNATTEPGKKPEKDIRPFDGKTGNGSGRKETDQPGTKPLHTLNSYSLDYGFCVTQNFVDEKTNEITAMPEILRRMDLSNSIATWDALNTQKTTVEAVIAGKGDYVGALKGNQHNFYQDVKDYFEPDVLARLREDSACYCVTKEKEHSAIVTREYYQTEDIKWLYNKEKWAGLKAIGMERKTIQKNNPNIPVSIEERYYISSFFDIKDFSRAVRGHWGVENGLHWHLDFTFKDDKNTTMRENGAKGLQIFKKLALAILKMAQCLYPKRTSLKSIRFILAMSFEREISNIFSMMNLANLKVNA
jgi:predicted transposase YbfD/YdcC